MSTISFRNVNKVYDNNVQAVFDFNLEVADKEFIVFVGPSGCGKSTTLRMICGLEDITSGEIYIDGKLINDLPPKDRDIAMVFQNYALYPHLTVYQNMAYALKLRKLAYEVKDIDGNPVYEIDHKKIDENLKLISDLSKEDANSNADEIARLKKENDDLRNNPSKVKIAYKHYSKEEIDEKIRSIANTLGLEPYLSRKPAALSGGQRQRVALGRAIVRNPKVFLMDEPLSNLDAKLRVSMRSEIAKIHENVGATTIYVTHDQTEAMTMANRIVIMKDGWIQQIGTPKELYNMPANLFVATFIGSPAMNIFKGEYKDGKITIRGGFTVDLGKSFQKVHDKFYEDQVKSCKENIASFEEQFNEYKASVKSHRKKILNFIQNKEEDLLRIKDALKQFEDILSGKEHELCVGIRPEDFYLAEDKASENPSKQFSLECDFAELLGHELILYAYIDGQKLAIKTSAKFSVNQGQKVNFVYDTKKIRIFDPISTERMF